MPRQRASIRCFVRPHRRHSLEGGRRLPGDPGRGVRVAAGAFPFPRHRPQGAIGVMEPSHGGSELPFLCVVLAELLRVELLPSVERSRLAPTLGTSRSGETAGKRARTPTWTTALRGIHRITHAGQWQPVNLRTDELISVDRLVDLGRPRCWPWGRRGHVLDPRRARRLRHIPILMKAEYVMAFFAAVKRAPLDPPVRRQCRVALLRWMLSHVPGFRLRDPRAIEVLVEPVGGTTPVETCDMAHCRDIKNPPAEAMRGGRT